MFGANTVRKNFVPADLAGCLAWFSSDVVDLESGKVRVWRNLIGGSGVVHGTQTTAAKQPAYDQVAGKPPSLLFTGVEGLNFPMPVVGTKTVVAILQMTVTPASGNYDYVVIPTGGNPSSFYCFINSAGYLKRSFLCDYFASTLCSGNDSALDTNLNVEIITWNGGTNSVAANYTLTSNGVDLAVSQGVGAAGDGVLTFPGSIGAYLDFSNNVSAALKGRFYELAIYNRALSAVEKNVIWGYAKARYKL